MTPSNDQVGFDELVTLARSIRAALGRVRALTDTDFVTDVSASTSWDAAELGQRLAAARKLVAAGDPRLTQLAKHEAESPGATAEQSSIVFTSSPVEPVPILPLLASGVPAAVQRSFRARGGARRGGGSRRPQDAATATAAAMEMAELVRDRPLLRFAGADARRARRPWVGFAKPAGSGSHTGWCSVTGAPPAGRSRASSWTRGPRHPRTRMATGVAVHFEGRRRQRRTPCCCWLRATINASVSITFRAVSPRPWQ